ncbi:LuxR C-terminal-related transcriptional regulator [Streptomyces pseudovenezuelae]|uniref:LuxR C-terminal-related transcriptional regulator n=1 Tax=Streptomyces pseudovenezuelae TaxID=67350 RepID=UPI0036E13FCD
MARDFDIGDRQFLSPEAVRVFGLITQGEHIPDAASGAVEELVQLGFVVLDAERGNRPVALDPRTVAQRRLTDMLAENAARIAKMAELPAVTDQLAVLYEGARWGAGPGSEYLDNPDVVNARLDDVVGAARWEILAAQPGGPRDEMQLNRSLARDSAALDRGVVKRTLYRDTVRDTAVTARYARQMSTRSGRSAEFRTMVGPFERAIIVDRETAFISNHLVEGAPPHAAWQITDRALVAYIAAEFGAKWRRADSWHGELRARGQQTAGGVDGPVGVRTTRRQREILRDIVHGRAQQATANRLGIALRTVTSEIAELKTRFNAESLPELTYKWALSPDRLVDDSAPAVEGGGEVTTEAAA